MKIHLQMLKFNYRTNPVAATILILSIILTFIGKISYVSDFRLFSKIDSFLLLVFVILFLLGNLIFYAQLGNFLRTTLNSQIFHMVPEIRKRVIKISLIYFTVYFLWFIYIVYSLEGISLSLFFTTWNLYFLSIMLTTFFYNKVSVYRSNKYIFLKLLFYFSIFGIMTIPQYQKDYFYPVFLFQAGFIGVVIYQMINFAINYISFNAQDNEVKGFGRFINRIEDFFENLPDSVLKRKIERSRNSRRKYVELFEVTIFGVKHWLFYILYPWFGGMFFSVIIDHSNMNIFISGMIGMIGAVFYSYIGNKEKISFLYVTSALPRNQFVNTVLYSIFRKISFFFLPFFPMMIITTYLYNQFSGSYMAYHVPLIVIACTLGVVMFIAWVVWMATLQFADFDRLHRQNKNNYFTRSFK
jgi:hypothetical protein